MKLIAHRGLFNGPDVNLENRPEQIELALSQGFDCEVDLWIVDGEMFLGHDRPDYPTTLEFLKTPGLWIHAKNLAALYYLSTTTLAYFWHQSDDCVITSNGYIWTFPGKELTDRSIRLMPEWEDKNTPVFVPLYQKLLTTKNNSCYAICSDYVLKIRELRG